MGFFFIIIFYFQTSSDVYLQKISEFGKYVS